MDILSTVLAVFALIGAVDLIIGNRLGLGKEFEKGVMLLGVMTMSMVGMLLIAPILAKLMSPLSSVIANSTPFDPSFVSAMLIANDMGGAPLSVEMSRNALVGAFNGFVVSSMLGCTISYTIPFALSTVDKKYHKEMFLGILCGFATIPVGCVVSGFIMGLSARVLFVNLVPVILFSLIVMLGLLTLPSLSVKVFTFIGRAVLAVITVGLALGIAEFLLKKEFVPYLAPLDEGMAVVINACTTMAGAFPLIKAVSVILKKPLSAVGRKAGLNSSSVLGFLASMASITTSYPMVPDMDRKGRMLNFAFSVSGSFVLAGHLAFTMAMRADLLPAVMAGKIVSGVVAVILASMIYKRTFRGAD